MLLFAIILSNNIITGKKYIQEIRVNDTKNEKDIVKNEVLKVVKFINYEKKYANKNLRKNIKEKVNIAYEIAESIYKNNKNQDKQIIIKMIKDALRNIRFNNGRGYYFIYTMNYKNILLPIAPKLENSDFYNYQDIKGVYVVRNVVKILQKKNKTYYTWYWHKANETKNIKKIGYMRYFKPLNWYIGTGEYVVDFEKILKNRILKQIQQIRYGKNGYIFVYDYNGVCLANKNTDFIGKNQLHSKRKNTRELIKKTIQIAKNGYGYLQYETIENPLIQKISFIMGIDDWHWEIGSGAYISDIEENILQKETLRKKKLLHNSIIFITIFLFTTITLILILMQLSKQSQKQFNLYKQALLKEVERNEKNLLLINQQTKLASMGEMIRNIAHQWRQPLNTLSIAVSKMILLKEEDKLTNEIMLSTFAKMEKNIIHLSDTIKVFMDFLRPHKGNEKFNLKTSIEHTILIVKDSFNNDFINIDCQCNKHTTIDGISQEFQQILIILLNNSKDAIISNKIKNAQVTISLKEDDENIHIYVQDNAGGIPKKIKDKIFEPYFSTKFKSQGIGIGLHIAKVSLEKYFQGKISFENTNNGTLFIIVIPKLQLP